MHFLCTTVVILFLMGAQQGYSEPEVFWINMNSSTARRDHIIKHFSSLNITKHHRIEGVDPTKFVFYPGVLENYNNLSYCEIPSVSFLRPNRTDVFARKYDPSKPIHVAIACGRRLNTLRELACTISHLIAMYEAVTSNDTEPYALITEDDIHFAFKIKFDEMVRTAPKKHAILQLLTSNERRINYLWDIFIERNGRKFWMKRPLISIIEQDYWCTGAYLIKKETLRGILQHIIYVRNDGSLEVRIIAGFSRPCFPPECCPNQEKKLYNVVVQDPPCVYAPRGFAADDFLYSLAPTFVLMSPLFTDYDYMNSTSTVHQHDVKKYMKGFKSIADKMDIMRKNKTNLLPFFAEEYSTNP